MEGWKKLFGIGLGMVFGSVIVGTLVIAGGFITYPCTRPADPTQFRGCIGPYIYYLGFGTLIPGGIVHQWLPLLAIPAVFGGSLILASLMIRRGKSQPSSIQGTDWLQDSPRPFNQLESTDVSITFPLAVQTLWQKRHEE